MLAAALGIQRNDDPKKLEPLTALRFGVRAEKEGRLLKDFHMVHSPKTTDVTERHYLSDAVFLVALESEDTAFLQKIAEALQHPVYPLYLGRKSCPPTLPIVWGVREKSLEAVLKEEPPLCNEKAGTFRIAYEVPFGGIPVQDVPQSFSQLHRQHGWRMKCEEIITGKEHDPFSEL
jgi:CRISPR system Cascade subunit CasD